MSLDFSSVKFAQKKGAQPPELFLCAYHRLIINKTLISTPGIMILETVY